MDISDRISVDENVPSNKGDKSTCRPDIRGAGRWNVLRRGNGGILHLQGRYPGCSKIC